MKRKLMLRVVSTLALMAMLLTGCASKQKVSSDLKAKNNIYQSSNASNANTVSSINKDAKSISDNDLLKSANEDSTTQLDSVDGQSQELNSDEINSLLNENTDLKNISSSFSVK